MRQPIAHGSRVIGLVRARCRVVPGLVGVVPRVVAVLDRAPPVLGFGAGWRTGRACRHRARVARPGRRHRGRRSKYHCSLIGSTLPRPVAPDCRRRRLAIRCADAVDRAHRPTRGGRRRDGAGRRRSCGVRHRSVARRAGRGRRRRGEEGLRPRSRVTPVLEPSADRQVHRCARIAVRVAADAAGCTSNRRRSSGRRSRSSASRCGGSAASTLRSSTISCGSAVRSTRSAIAPPSGSSAGPTARSATARSAATGSCRSTSCPIAESSLSRLLRQIELDEGAEITLRTSVATGQITAIWSREHHKGVRGVPTDGAHRRAGLVDRTDRRRRPAGVGGLVLPIRGAGRRAARRRRRAGRARAGHRRATPSMPTAVSACSPPRRWRPPATSRSSNRRSRPASTRKHNLADRSATIVKAEVGRWRADPGRPVDVVVADPARSGLGKPGADVLTAVAAAGVRAGQLRPGVARPRRHVDGAARLRARIGRGARPVPEHAARRDGHPIHAHPDMRMSAGDCPRADILGDGRLRA